MAFKNSKEMYANSPKLSRGEDGKMSVHKKEQESNGEADASAGHEGEPVQVKNEESEEHDMHARHNLDRHTMHARHEHEHAMHKHGDKKEMHARHGKEHGEMLKRHDSEMGSGRKDAMTKGAEIEKEGA